MPRPLPWTILLCFLLACSSGDEPSAPGTGPPDGTPSTVTDLHIASATDQSLTLVWTAPGVATSTTALAAYDLRRTPLGQELQDWDNWQSVETRPPAIPGAAEQTIIEGLAAGSTWVFRLRSFSNDTWSALSAPVVASVHPQWDQTPPAAITDLELSWRSETDLLVAWNATGDDAGYGSAALYEVRHGNLPLDDAGWDDATVASAPARDPLLGRWTCQVTGLDETATVHVAVRAQDDAGNWSGTSNDITAEPPTGNVWHVSVDGTGTVPTIAEGIRNAAAGDLVLVHPGRYTWTNQGGPMNELGMISVGQDTSDITIASVAGPEATIIDAEQQGRVLFLQANHGVVIEGFTLTGGVSVDPDGEVPTAGGIFLHLSSTTVRNCIIEGNSGDANGGAVFFAGVGTPTFEHCIFRNNHAADYGGAIFAINVHGSGPDHEHGIAVIDCVVENNTAGIAGGGLCLVRTVALVEDCVITGNSAAEGGGGVEVIGYGIPEATDTWAVLNRCTMTDNTAPLGAAVNVVTSYEDREGRARLTSCIVTGHSQPKWLNTDDIGILEVGCSDFFDNAGTSVLPAEFTDLGGNFWLDPLFCGGDGDGRWALQEVSPCLPGAHPDGTDCGRIGAREVGCGR